MGQKHPSFTGLLALLALLATFGIACGPVGSATPPPQAPTTTEGTSTVTEDAHDRKGPPVVARIAISQSEVQRDSDLEVIVNIENRSKDPVILSEEELTSPSVLFEVRNHMGERVLPSSAPVPTGRNRTIEPGKRLEIRMKLAGMFSPPLKPGEYSVRLKRINSTPHAFKVVN
jgi:hypothetical protein